MNRVFLWACAAALSWGIASPTAADTDLVRVLGFSDDGWMAYEQENPRCVCAEGRCLETEFMCEYEKAAVDCQRECLPIEQRFVDLRTETERQLVPKTLDSDGAIKINESVTPLVPLPALIRGDRYAIELNGGCDEIGDLEGDFDVVQECVVFLVSEQRGRKRVFVHHSRETRGFRLTLLGVVARPSEPLVALLFETLSSPFEDETYRHLFFVAANLDVGFAPTSEPH